MFRILNIKPIRRRLYVSEFFGGPIQQITRLQQSNPPRSSLFPSITTRLRLLRAYLHAIRLRHGGIRSGRDAPNARRLIRQQLRISVRTDRVEFSALLRSD